MDDMILGTSGGPGGSKPFRRQGVEDAQVKLARIKFKSVLKHLAQEKCIQEESDSDTEDNTLYKHKMSRAGSGLSMPPHKRSKTGNGEAVRTKVAPAFVMKLFDRGVDLAQFHDGSPLYPICRAWIQNKPHAFRVKRETEKTEEDPEEMDYREDTGEVFHLPQPEPLPYDEYGLQMTCRIPALLPRPELDEPFNINYTDEDAPPPAILFQGHLDRWAIIRGRWKEACAYNEARYDSSFGMLRQIYERNRPEDTSVTVSTTSDGETGM